MLRSGGARRGCWRHPPPATQSGSQPSTHFPTSIIGRVSRRCPRASRREFCSLGADVKTTTVTSQTASQAVSGSAKLRNALALLGVDHTFDSSSLAHDASVDILLHPFPPGRSKALVSNDHRRHQINRAKGMLVTSIALAAGGVRSGDTAATRRHIGPT